MQDKRYKEIDMIRCMLIIVLVVFHALCPYTSWGLTDGLSSSNLYIWMDKFLYQGMLETFVCISGYLYFASLDNRKSGKQNFLYRKITRLYIPALLWGIVYSISFTEEFKITEIINGIGHLWFLPMLFCIFFLEELGIARFSSKYLLLYLFLFAIIPYPTLPLHLNNSIYYLLFFHYGQWIYRHKYTFMTSVFEKIKIKHILILFLFVQVLLYIQLRTSAPYDGQPIIEKSLVIFFQKLLSIPMATAMMIIYWKIACNLINIIDQIKYLKTFSTLSFGIYIVQEFVLRILYYHTDLPCYLGLASPWCFSIITLLFSFLLSKLINDSKYLRFIFGN